MVSLISIFKAAMLQLAITSCSQYPRNVTIINASVIARTNFVSSAERLVSLSLSSSDLAAVGESESYVHALLFDCSNRDGGDPSELSLNGRPIDDFALTRQWAEGHAGKSIELRASYPAKVFDAFPRRCITLTGGPYLGPVVRSNIVELRDQK